MSSEFNKIIQQIDFKKNPLIPAIIQDKNTRQVLMLGFMNEEALTKTIKEKKVTFFSRSKQCLWTKGETSGNFLLLEKTQDIKLDCDQDTLLIYVIAPKHTCHLKKYNCFQEEKKSSLFLEKLFELIQDRKKNKLQNSYTTQLFKKGLNKIAQKVGEEGVEVVIAALKESKSRLKSEAADLIFHFLILLVESGVSLNDICKELEKRHKKR